jgi:glycosyltransferase involved in cell wall biosynthesis
LLQYGQAVLNKIPGVIGEQFNLYQYTNSYFISVVNIILLAHPPFLGQQSMARYVNMLANGMKERGHTVEVWSPNACFSKLFSNVGLKKWLGYFDQYFLFPIYVRRRIKNCDPDTLFVICDHALGPWVPLIADRPHVIHCHDFLAQRSALGEIVENKTQWTGRIYQAYIRRGYSKGKNFISISEETKQHLEKFISNASISTVIHNGLNQCFKPADQLKARSVLNDLVKADLQEGYILHVGGNQWYKNRIGVIEIYDAWRSLSSHKLPLIMIGQEPDSNLLRTYRASSCKEDIYILSGIGDNTLKSAYTGASVFLFPSLAEGFGWPIAEAMASGCPVITTNEPPMTEVAGKAGFLVPRKPFNKSIVRAWALDIGMLIEQIINKPLEELKVLSEESILNASRFDHKIALDKIEAVYHKVLSSN